MTIILTLFPPSHRQEKERVAVEAKALLEAARKQREEEDEKARAAARAEEAERARARAEVDRVAEEKRQEVCVRESIALLFTAQERGCPRRNF